MVASLSRAVSACSLLTLCSLFGRAVRERFFESMSNPDILWRISARSFAWYQGCGVRGEASAPEVAATVLRPWSARMASRCSGGIFLADCARRRSPLHEALLGGCHVMSMEAVCVKSPVLIRSFSALTPPCDPWSYFSLPERKSFTNYRRTAVIVTRDPC